MTENSERGITEYKLYLEKISSIIHVSPKIGTLIFLAEWYLIYVIASLNSKHHWLLFHTTEFWIGDIIPLILVPTVGWGLLYLRKSYIRSSKKLKLLLEESAYKELFYSMIRRRLTIILCVIFALFAFADTILPLYGSLPPLIHDYAYCKQDLAGRIYIIHNLIWFLVIGIPVLAEFVSLIFGIMLFPYLISKAIRYDAINPIEPYRRGGLRPVGELCFSGAFLYFLILIIFSLYFIITPMMNILVFIMWIVGILMFLAPLYKVHEILHKAKSNMLNNITSQINEESKMHDLINGRITEKDAISLYTLMFTFTEIEKMHEYPFDLKIWRDFLVIAIIPLIIQLVILVVLNGSISF